MLIEPKNNEVAFLAMKEETARESVIEGLAAAGYGIETAAVDETLEHKLLHANWNIVILDFGAGELLRPHIDDICRPISIVLTEGNRPEDAVRALQYFGADACLDQHIDVRVLVATIQSLCRRVVRALPVETLPRIGEERDVWRISATNWTISCPRGHAAKLTRPEIDFFLSLAREPGSAVPRDRIITAMGHNPDAYDPRRLDTFVSRMRSKLGCAFSASLPLRAVHAVGYAFVAPLELVD